MITAGLILLPFIENDKHCAGFAASPALQSWKSNRRRRMRTADEFRVGHPSPFCRFDGAHQISPDNYCWNHIVYYSPMLIARQALNAEE